MLELNQTEVEALINSFTKARIAVIGDLMLDRYIFGVVGRISPEAPVPVVDIHSEQARLGGAANVGYNILGLGATPIMFGVVGNDTEGLILKGIFGDFGFPLSGIITDQERRTTVKTRVIAGSQHMLRIDQEHKHDISRATEDELLNVLGDHADALDGIILEDYNKGVITRSLIHKVIEFANEHSIPVFVDPKFENFFEYRQSTVFKPNRKEVEDALGMRLQTDEDVEKAGRKLLSVLQSKYVLLTLGERGMLLFQSGQDQTFAIPTRARQVADVSGAGDTVIATLAVAMAAGADIEQAALLANRAAGLVIEELGIVPIYREQLATAIMEDIDSTL